MSSVATKKVQPNPVEKRWQFSALDFLINKYLHGIYINADLVVCQTIKCKKILTNCYTILQLKHLCADGVTVQYSDFSVKWNIDTWVRKFEPQELYDVIGYIIESSLPWLDTNLERCGALKGVDIFSAERSASDGLDWHQVVFKAEAKSSAPAVRSSETSKDVQWCF